MACSTREMKQFIRPITAQLTTGAQWPQWEEAIVQKYMMSDCFSHHWMMLEPHFATKSPGKEKMQNVRQTCEEMVILQCHLCTNNMLIVGMEMQQPFPPKYFPSMPMLKWQSWRPQLMDSQHAGAYDRPPPYGHHSTMAWNRHSALVPAVQELRVHNITTEPSAQKILEADCSDMKMTLPLMQKQRLFWHKKDDATPGVGQCWPLAAEDNAAHKPPAVTKVWQPNNDVTAGHTYHHLLKRLLVLPLDQGKWQLTGKNKLFLTHLQLLELLALLESLELLANHYLVFDSVGQWPWPMMIPLLTSCKHCHPNKLHLAFLHMWLVQATTNFSPEERGERYGLAWRVLHWWQRWREGPLVLWGTMKGLPTLSQLLSGQDKSQVHVLDLEEGREGEGASWFEPATAIVLDNEDTSRREEGHKDVDLPDFSANDRPKIEGSSEDTSTLHQTMATWLAAYRPLHLGNEDTLGLSDKTWGGSQARSR